MRTQLLAVAAVIGLLTACSAAPPDAPTAPAASEATASGDAAESGSADGTGTDDAGDADPDPHAAADEGDTGDTDGTDATTGATDPDDEPETPDGTNEYDLEEPDVDPDGPAARAADRDARPDWLGTRELPLRPDGLGEVQPTPPELADRRLAPSAAPLDPPPDGRFHAEVTPVPPDVAARSTFHDGCPVDLDELAYLQVAFWGFDGRAHTGEVIANQSAAQDLVGVFEVLFDARFPIEELRITEAAELDAHPTGDGNTSGAFVCRSAVESGRWSDHAYGLAIDLNPFHNPYLRDDVVIPELASAYLDRDDVRPGMIVADDEVVEAFAAIGWSWGGDWSSAKDWMHFSASGR